MSGASAPVPITGLGAICGAGVDVDAIWDSIVSGSSAVRTIRGWDIGDWPVRLAAEATELKNRELVSDRKIHKLLSRTDLLGLYAAEKAIESSQLLSYRDGLDEKDVERFNDDTGVLAGSGGGTYSVNYDFLPLLSASDGDMRKFGQELSMNVSPMWLLRILPNNVVCHVGIRSGFKGTNACITNHCAGGSMAMSEAAAAIRVGEAERAVAVGHEAPIEAESVARYDHLGLLTHTAVRPFDRGRDGTSLGEGAAAMVLESRDSVKARGAEVLGEFLGYGCAGEATGIVGLRADGDGMRRAIQGALRDAGLDPTDVGMIVAHGNGTPASDASEAEAIRDVFGAESPPVTGFKWATGHLLAASGSLDIVLGLTALRRGVVPGIATLDELDPAIAPLPVSKAPQEPRGDVALVLCRGFGGMNVAVTLRAS